MTHELSPLDPGLLPLLKASFDDNNLPLPYVTEIFLLECQIAGTSYVNLEEVEPQLQAGQLRVCQREPANPHDSLAIRLRDEQGRKLRYVPRAKNEVLARLMDAGKLVFSRIQQKEWVNGWLKLTVRVYMRDLWGMVRFVPRRRRGREAREPVDHGRCHFAAPGGLWR